MLHSNQFYLPRTSIHKGMLSQSVGTEPNHSVVDDLVVETFSHCQNMSWNVREGMLHLPHTRSQQAGSKKERSELSQWKIHSSKTTASTSFQQVTSNLKPSEGSHVCGAKTRLSKVLFSLLLCLSLSRKGRARKWKQGRITIGLRNKSRHFFFLA